MYKTNKYISIAIIFMIVFINCFSTIAFAVNEEDDNTVNNNDIDNVINIKDYEENSNTVISLDEVDYSNEEVIEENNQSEFLTEEAIQDEKNDSSKELVEDNNQNNFFAEDVIQDEKDDSSKELVEENNQITFSTDNKMTNTNSDTNVVTSTNTKTNTNTNTQKNVIDNIIENNQETDVKVIKDIEVSTQLVTNPSVSYSVHVQKNGWMEEKKNSETAGTTGKALRMEAIKINVTGLENVNIKYQTYVQNIGWQDWKSNGEIAGTVGQCLRLEALKIRLESSENYSVKYRTYIQKIGWQDWKSDGDISGTLGQGLRVEAIQIQIVNKIKKGIVGINTPTENMKFYNDKNISVSGWKMSNLKNTKIKAYIDDKYIDTVVSYYTKNEVINIISGYGTAVENPTPGFSFSFSPDKLDEGNHTIKISICDENNNVLNSTKVNILLEYNPHVLYKSYVQKIGWQDYKKDGETSGTEGRSYRLEAIQIKLLNAPDNAKIKYRTHVQDIGWMNWKSDDQLSGTKGQALRVEAIEIKLENLDKYTIEYQVHMQGKGWSNWYIDGETAGTIGESRRIEAIRIRLVPKYKRRYLGIDVSRFNGTIDWNAVRSSGVDFAMIRVGYRGYAQEGNFAEDWKFRENIEGAKAAGIKVGIYFFTQAITEQEAIEEADWTYLRIKDYKIDMPVAIDVEFSSESNNNGRADHLDKATRTAITKRFCERIQAYGYTPMVYLNVDWSKNYVNMDELTQFDTWIAHYKNDPNLAPNYQRPYAMWQYTSSGRINGVNGDVDCNICYKNY